MGADLSIRSRDGTPIDIATEEIKCILNGAVDMDNIPDEISKNKATAPVPVSKDSESSIVHSEIEENNICDHQLQVQQNMLAHYTAEAHKNGMPKALPIFCKQCLKPFTYPVGAISIKCPMCLTVNEIIQK